MYLDTVKKAIFLTICLPALTGQAVETETKPDTPENVQASGKESACKPERWKKTIAEFKKADENEPPGEGGAVFVGSSSIRLWNLPKYFPNLKRSVNRGFGGSELCDSVHYFDTLVAKQQPNVVVLYAGDNDIAGGKKAKQVHADFQAFNKQMLEKLPKAKLMYISIKPSIARWKLAEEMQEANALIAADCKKDSKRLAFVDIWEPMLDEEGEPRRELFVGDGLHLNEDGYEMWTGRLRQQLFYWSR